MAHSNPLFRMLSKREWATVTGGFAISLIIVYITTSFHFNKKSLVAADSSEVLTSSSFRCAEENHNTSLEYKKRT